MRAQSRDTGGVIHRHKATIVSIGPPFLQAVSFKNFSMAHIDAAQLKLRNHARPQGTGKSPACARRA